MFKSILVPTDGSEHSRVALKYAINVAQAYQSRIVLLSVVDIRRIAGPFLAEMAGAGNPALGVEVAAVADWLKKQGRRYVDSLKSECDATGLSCDTRLTTGVVTQEIIDQAKTCDMVVMGRHGEHYRFRGPLPGSTIEGVVRGTIRPVLVTPEAYAPFSRVLVAYDGNQHSSDALTVAADLAKGLQIPLVLLTIDRDPTMARERMDAARAHVESHRLDVTEVVALGDPTQEILNTCRHEHCNLIAMGAYGHSQLREMIIGSTTTRVMRKATCPVLLFR